ncbi:MAG: helix-turn-helix domain-containing protein [Mycobacteriales bacterium]
MAYAERVSTRSAAVLWRTAGIGPARVLPDGHMDLIWMSGKLLVAGPDITAVTVDRERSGEIWGLRLPRGVASRIFGMSAAELLNRRIDLADLVPAEFIQRAEESLTSKLPHSVLEELLLELMTAAEITDRTLRRARSISGALATGRPVTEIAAAFGISTRQLHRYSIETFGYSPKTLGSIHRFQRARWLIRSGKPLAAAAAGAGYADQSHMSRELQRLAQATPRQLSRGGETITP